jgi:hypothetical protein
MRHALIALVAAIVCTHAARGADYFVTTAGNDANPGTSAGQPVRTVSRALQLAAAGDTIYVGAGTYQELLRPAASGTSSQPIRLIGDTTGQRTGMAGTITISHWTTPTVRLQNVNWISFQDITISGSSTPLELNSARNITLTGVTIQESSGVGITLASSTLTMTGGTIRSGSSHGITVGASSTLIASGLTIRDLSGDGVRLNAATAGADLDACTIRSIGGAAVHVISGFAAVTNTIIRDLNFAATLTSSQAVLRFTNNVVSGCSNGISMSQGVLWAHNNIFTGVSSALARTAGTATHSHNLYHSVSTRYSGLTAGTGDLTGDPSFVNTESFRLQSNSPAINAGVFVFGVRLTDRDGLQRPTTSTPDIGLYEVGATSPTGSGVSLTIERWSEIEPR